MDLLSDTFNQHDALRHVAHRPWPLPSGDWLMGQTWHKLLFAHWRVPAELLEPLIPAPLTLDTCDGDAWLGVTPFTISGLRLRGGLPVPVVSSFPEFNVRTYVSQEGKEPGIWFFSLDTTSRSAVAAARRLYRLPYHRAAIRTGRTTDGEYFFSGERRRSIEPARLIAGYAPVSAVTPASEAAPLEQFLTERYCLYTTGDDGQVCQAHIHHAPWPLQTASGEIRTTGLGPAGILIEGEPLLHYAHRLDVLIWPLAPLSQKPSPEAVAERLGPLPQAVADADAGASGT